jgi:hypothetical protein
MLSALVHRVGGAALIGLEQRGAERQQVSLQATGQAEGVGGLLWGAVVKDISARGVGIILGFPYKPGIMLALALPTATGGRLDLVARIVHVHELTGGRWRFGCEFVTPLTDAELASVHHDAQVAE